MQIWWGQLHEGVLRNEFMHWAFASSERLHFIVRNLHTFETIALISASRITFETDIPLFVSWGTDKLLLNCLRKTSLSPLSFLDLSYSSCQCVTPFFDRFHIVYSVHMYVLGFMFHCSIGIFLPAVCVDLLLKYRRLLERTRAGCCPNGTSIFWVAIPSFVMMVSEKNKIDGFTYFTFFLQYGMNRIVPTLVYFQPSNMLDS